MADFHARKIDVSRPTAARLYDYYLGGEHNYTVDQQFAEQAYRLCPFLPDMAAQNRDFLARAVTHCAEQGVRQFIDIGSGVPTRGNVHEIVHQIDPGIRVIYVDNDLEAVVTAQDLLQDVDCATSIEADLREPDTILKHPDTNRLIDFAQPTALLIVSVLHFLGSQDNPHALVARYLDELAPGSFFVASHISVDEAEPDARAQLEALEREYGNTANPATLRSRDEFAQFFDGLQLVEPGVTFAADWHVPEPVAPDNPARACFYAAVGRKP